MKYAKWSHLDICEGTRWIYLTNSVVAPMLHRGFRDMLYGFKCVFDCFYFFLYTAQLSCIPSLTFLSKWLPLPRLKATHNYWKIHIKCIHDGYIKKERQQQSQHHKTWTKSGLNKKSFTTKFWYKMKSIKELMKTMVKGKLREENNNPFTILNAFQMCVWCISSSPRADLSFSTNAIDRYENV